jgi:hypothetical protein
VIGREEGGGRGGDGGKIKWKVSEVNFRAVSREQNELIGKFKMAADDVIICTSVLSFPHGLFNSFSNSKI